MRRREFVSLAIAAGFWPQATGAQARVRRIGRLNYSSESDPTSRRGASALANELRRLGWKEAESHIDSRFGEGEAGRTAAAAKELVALAPEVIVARGTPATRVAMQETRTIPIVFVSVSDPVGDRFVQSIANPGGNVTGFTNLDAGMGGKWLDLLREAVPGITRIAALSNPDVATAGGTFYLRVVSEAAASLGMTVDAVPVRSTADIERALERLASTSGAGLIGMPDPFVVVHGKLLIDLAARYRIPAIYGFRNLAVEGGLMSYGVDLVDLDRRAASYVDRILKGERPGDLPIQAPTKFELVLNLRTANALGLTISPTLLARADEVIE